MAAGGGRGPGVRGAPQAPSLGAAVALAGRGGGGGRCSVCDTRVCVCVCHAWWYLGPRGAGGARGVVGARDGLVLAAALAPQALDGEGGLPAWGRGRGVSTETPPPLAARPAPSPAGPALTCGGRRQEPAPLELLPFEGPVVEGEVPGGQRQRPPPAAPLPPSAGAGGRERSPAVWGRGQKEVGGISPVTGTPPPPPPGLGSGGGVSPRCYGGHGTGDTCPRPTGGGGPSPPGPLRG